jgi:hypothetical protein
MSTLDDDFNVGVDAVQDEKTINDLNCVSADVCGKHRIPIDKERRMSL